MNKPVLGESITISSSWTKIKQAGQEAIINPRIWVPLLGAVLLQVDNLDNEISDHLREHTPVFGSTERASNRSDDLASLTTVAYVSTALLAPGPAGGGGEWFTTKAKLLGSEWLAVKTARSMTSGLKSLTKRDRPNNLEDRSLPSGHATRASAQAQMANLNVEYLPINSGAQQTLKWTFDGLAALTGWARVEAGMHFPSDVLAGWALGHFIADLAKGFINPHQEVIQVYPQSLGEGIGFRLVIRF